MLGSRHPSTAISCVYIWLWKTAHTWREARKKPGYGWVFLVEKQGGTSEEKPWASGFPSSALPVWNTCGKGRQPQFESNIRPNMGHRSVGKAHLGLRGARVRRGDMAQRAPRFVDQPLAGGISPSVELPFVWACSRGSGGGRRPQLPPLEEELALLFSSTPWGLLRTSE
jgi:hypothetical protein